MVAGVQLQAFWELTYAMSPHIVYSDIFKVIGGISGQVVNSGHWYLSQYSSY